MPRRSPADGELLDAPMPDLRSHSAQITFAILGALLLIVSILLAVASLRSPIVTITSYGSADFVDVRTTVCVALCFAAVAVLVAVAAAARRRRPEVRAASIAALVAVGLSASAVAMSAGMLQSEMFTGVAYERALQAFWVFIAALPFAGIGILDRPEAERRDHPIWAHPVLRGIGLSAALFAVCCTVLTLSALSATASTRSAWQITLALAAYALVSAAVTVVGMTERVRSRSQDTTMPWVFGSVLALCSIPIVLSFANLLSPYVPVLQRLDSRPVVLLAVLSAAAGAVATLCLAFYTNPSFPKEDPYPDYPRRQVLVVGVASFLVATVGAGLLVATRPEIKPAEVSPLAQPVSIPPVPTTMGPTAFTLQLPERPDRITLRAGGPGFIVSAGAGLTAHDGRTGAVRWRLDVSALGGDVGGGRHFTVFGTGPDAVVVVVARHITIGLDAMTGRLRWKSAAPVFRHSTRYPLAWANFYRDDGPRPSKNRRSNDQQSQLGVIDPYTGQVARTIDTSCYPEHFASSERYVILPMCHDSSTELRVIDISTGATRKLQIPGVRVGDLADVRHLAGDLFGAVYDRRRTYQDDGEPVPNVVAVFDAAKGVEIDRFDVVGDIGPMRDGLIPSAQQQGSKILIRDTTTRKSIRVPVPVERVSWNDGVAGGIYDRENVLGWLGATLLVGEPRRLLLVDPQKRTVTVRDSPCTRGPLLQATAAPGSTVFTCLRSENDVTNSDDTTEIVGTG